MSASSEIVPAVLIGGAILGAVALAVHVGTRDRAKTVDEEAYALFPPPFGRMSGTHAAPGRKLLAYRASVGRCFYKKLREEHSPDQAAQRALSTVQRYRGWLNEFARTGRSIRTGCNFLMGHIRMSGKQIARSRSTATR